MSNICFVNGSPKANAKSNSDFFINEFLNYIENNSIISRYYASKVVNDKESLEKILSNDIIIFVSPLYADTFPSRMLEFLCNLEVLAKNKDHKNIKVYGIVNCGFYEGRQCRHALDMLKYFSRKCGFTWKFGITIGGGEYLKSFKDGLKNTIHAESLCNAFDMLAQSINNPDFNQNENICTSPDKMSAGIYRLASNFGWCYSVFKSKTISIPELFKKIY
jgi:multimeric flavodoxin WrbA